MPPPSPRPAGRFTEIDRLFARHKLGPVETVEPLTGGQLNVAVRVNGDYVLRCREPSLSTGSLHREAQVLKRVAGRVPVPEVLFTGTDHVLGEYSIQGWKPGRTLLDAWLSNPEVSTREWWLLEWAAVIRAIHEERFPRPGEFQNGEVKEVAGWRRYVEGRLRKRLDLLMRVPAMDRDLVLAAEKYVRRKAGVLEDGPYCLIHRDLHFANVLVDGPNLSAILDWELAEVGTPDYELDTIYRFLRYPWQFTSPAAAANRVTPVRFASVWMRLRRSYPELFAVRHLRERLSLYGLDRALSSLIQAYGGRWGGEGATEGTLRHIGEILQDHYGPE